MMEACCTDAANRRVETETPSLRTELCQVCMRRHYTLRVDPIPVGVTLEQESL